MVGGFYQGVVYKFKKVLRVVMCSVSLLESNIECKSIQNKIYKTRQNIFVENDVQNSCLFAAETIQIDGKVKSAQNSILVAGERIIVKDVEVAENAVMHFKVGSDYDIEDKLEAVEEEIASLEQRIKVISTSIEENISGNVQEELDKLINRQRTLDSILYYLKERRVELLKLCETPSRAFVLIKGEISGKIKVTIHNHECDQFDCKGNTIFLLSPNNTVVGIKYDYNIDLVQELNGR